MNRLSSILTLALALFMGMSLATGQTTHTVTLTNGVASPAVLNAMRGDSVVFTVAAGSAVLASQQVPANASAFAVALNSNQNFSYGLDFGGTYTYTTSTGSGDTATYRLEVNCPANELPSLTAPVPQAACVGETVLLQATASSQNGVQIAWTFNGSPVATGTDYAHTLRQPNATTETVLVSATDAQTGCTVSDSIAVGVNFTPQIISNTQVDVCLDGAVTDTLSANIFNNVPANRVIDITWMDDNNQTLRQTSGAGLSTDDLVVGPFTQAGSFTYEVLVTTDEGCEAIKTVTHVVKPSPQVALNTLSSDICEGESISLQSTTTQNATTNWSLTGQAVELQTVGNQAHLEALNAGTAALTAIVDLDGCTVTETINLTVNSLPTLLVNGYITVCRNEITTVKANSGQPNVSFSWANLDANGEIVNGVLASKADLRVATGQTAQFAVRVQDDASGCATTSVVTVTSQDPQPAPIAFLEQRVSERAITVAALNTGNTAVNWLFSDGTELTGQSVSHQFDTATESFTVTVITGTPGICFAENTQTISFSALGSGEGLASLGMSLYPNPSNGNVTVSGVNAQNGTVTYRVVDLAGRTHQTGILSGTSLNLDVASGLYVLSLQTEDGQVAHERIQIAR